jgi:hypothetical protein
MTGKAAFFGDLSGVDEGFGSSSPCVKAVSLCEVALFVGNGRDRA